MPKAVRLATLHATRGRIPSLGGVHAPIVGQTKFSSCRLSSMSLAASGSEGALSGEELTWIRMQSCLVGRSSHLDIGRDEIAAPRFGEPLPVYLSVSVIDGLKLHLGELQDSHQ